MADTHPPFCPVCTSRLLQLTDLPEVQVVCPACSSEISLKNGQITLLQSRNIRQFPQHFPLPLGQIGTLAGIDWQVVGFCRRRTTGRKHAWDEYLLWHPLHGIRCLTQDRGFWTLDAPLEQPPSVPKKDEAAIRINGKNFIMHLLSRYHAEVELVAGEWPERIQVGDQTYHKEFIDPPNGLVEMRILQKGVVTATRWMHIRHKDREDIARAFSVPVERLPKPEIIGKVAPFFWQEARKGMLIAACVTTLLMLAMLYVEIRREIPLHQQLTLPATGKDAEAGEIALPLFTLSRPVEALRLSVTCRSAEYGDIEVDGLLVNTTTGETYPVWFWYEDYGPEGGGLDGLPRHYKDLSPGTYTLIADVVYCGRSSGKVSFEMVLEPAKWPLLVLILLMVWGIYAVVSLKEITWNAIRWTIGTENPPQEEEHPEWSSYSVFS